MSDTVRIYRPFRGNLDNWRQYAMLCADNRKVVNRISAGQLLDYRARGLVQFKAGRYTSECVELSQADGRALLCELAANPRVDPHPLRLRWIPPDELRQCVLRFDRPPYFGGRVVGLTIAILFTTLFGLGGLAALLLGITKAAAQPHASTLAFLATVGTTTVAIALFVAASDCRALYFYFRLPRDLRL